MAKQNEIIKKASVYIFDLFKQRLPEYLVYHTYSHTEMVAETARKIGKGMKLGEEGLEVVTLAGWFHDTGYTELYKGHEEVSIRLATDFLNREDYPPEKIELVAGCIRATIIPQKPRNLLEEVVADADLSGLGRKSFFEKSELLHVEWEKALGVTFTDQEWAQKNLDLLTGHKFFTRYAEESFSKQQTENILVLSKKLHKGMSPKEEVALEKIGIEREKITRAAEKDARPERGIETMFKIFSHNLMTSSTMADHKAQTLIRSNSVIIAGIAGLVLRKLIETPDARIAIPIFILLGVAVLTIFFSVLATRPQISLGFTNRDEITNKKSNLLFFGNFFNMPYVDFNWGIKEMMGDKEFLYDSLIQDCYFHGQTVAKKYRYLYLSYSIFMYGLAVAIAAFITLYFFGTTEIPIP